MASLLEELVRLRKELEATQSEKKVIEDWADKYRKEMEAVGSLVALGSIWGCGLV